MSVVSTYLVTGIYRASKADSDTVRAYRYELDEHGNLMFFDKYKRTPFKIYKTWHDITCVIDRGN